MTKKNSAKKVMENYKKIVILAAMHGDEVYGIELFDAFIGRYPNLKEYVSLVIGNKEALSRKIRFVDTDMNRSFGLKHFNNETRQIERVKQEIDLIMPDYILDIHTTRRKSGIFFISDKASGIKKDLCGFMAYDMCVMKDPVIERSFIGNDDRAVSLEYSLDAITDEKTREFVDSLKALIVGEKQHHQQVVYDVLRLITRNEYNSYSSLKNYDDKPEGIALMVPSDETEMDAEYFGFWCIKVN